MASESAETARGPGEKEQQLAIWTPQPGPQANAIAADWCPCIFYGGGKYSGKSDFLLGDYLTDLETYREHWQGIIFRRALTEFTELKLRASELFPKAGGVWQEQKGQWIFPDFGTKDMVPTLRFRYLKNLKEISLYEGHSYPWIGVDELGDWEDEKAFFRLFTFNRYGRHPIPNKRIRATGNPGGRGHQWIKKYFVDPAPLGSKLLYDTELKSNYMFILGTYRDNQIGMANDPGYADKMNRAGSKALVKALKNGDFSVVAGAFFKFDQRHIIKPFKIPSHWNRYMSMDWGACGPGDPFSIGWWAVSDGTDENGTIPYFKRGTKIRYREWYGKQYSESKVTIDFVADGIKAREGWIPTGKLDADGKPILKPGSEYVSYRVVGGDIKKKLEGRGKSIFEMFGDFHIHFLFADMSRPTGWAKMDLELKGIGPVNEETPNVFVFDTCIDSIQIIPAVQHAINDSTDIEPSNDDLPDEWRYGLNARDYATDKPAAEKPLEEKFVSPTVDELWAERERMLSGRR
jgi:hypothetical protein